MSYALRKLFSFIMSLALVSLMSYVSLQVLPGDPAWLILGTEGDPDALHLLRERLGLDQPFWERYVWWLERAVAGDFGESLRYSVPVADLIRRALPITLSLAFLSVAVAVVIALPFGIGCAIHKGRWLDSLGLVLSQAGMAVPGFWLGILLIQFFSVRLGLLPPGGYNSPISLGLPALALALPRGAVLTRMVRSSVLQVLSHDYIRTAHSKGLPYGVVICKHALRNAGVTICTVAGIQFIQLLAGTIVIEQVFGLPGLGQLLMSAVLQRDLPLVQGLVVLGASLILLANLFFDLALPLLDPRIRFH